VKGRGLRSLPELRDYGDVFQGASFSIFILWRSCVLHCW